MKNNLKTFPKEYLNIDPIWQWHYYITQELKEQLKAIEEAQNHPDFWRYAASYEAKEIQIRKQFIKEILGCVEKDGGKTK